LIAVELPKCPGITEMPFKVTEMSNGKTQYPGIRCVILLQTFSENILKIGEEMMILSSF
jgi:hypothetical protein